MSGRDPISLPITFADSADGCLIGRARGDGGPDRVGRGAQVVSGNMGHRDRLTG